MITYTPDEIEKNRQEAINMLASEDEQGNVDPGFVLADHVPGTLSYHEALHTASIVMDQADRHLLEHRAIILDPEAYTLAHEAFTALFNLYQHLGAKHL